MLNHRQIGYAPARSTRLRGCRGCNEPGLKPFLDLGVTPFADSLIDPARPAPERAAPLVAAFCPSCSLVQILDTVHPEDLFDADYPYFSSFSAAVLGNARDNALELMSTRRLGPQSLVVELASNDGYLLKNYVAAGIPVLGIDPAPGPVAAALADGVRSVKAFFTQVRADELAGTYGLADVVHANNVLAHVADANGFLAGISRILKPGGVAVIEAPYVRDLIDHTEFDTIYHEHLCYFSVTSVDRLVRRHGLFLTDVRRLPIHGGSLRLFLEKRDGPSGAVSQLLAEERRDGLDRFDFYAAFAARVDELTLRLRRMIRELKSSGATIAAYGAAAKGATLINHAGIDATVLEFVADRNVHKHGKLMPGMHVPIVPAEDLQRRRPDYALLLAWNHAEEILEQQKAYQQAGGRFIIPVPLPRIA